MSEGSAGHTARPLKLLEADLLVLRCFRPVVGVDASTKIDDASVGDSETPEHRANRLFASLGVCRRNDLCHGESFARSLVERFKDSIREAFCARLQPVDNAEFARSFSNGHVQRVSATKLRFKLGDALLGLRHLRLERHDLGAYRVKAFAVWNGKLHKRDSTARKIVTQQVLAIITS